MEEKQEINKIIDLYKELCEKHSRPSGQWKLWCKRPKTLTEKEEIVVGAILTQRTNWNNVEMAIDNLKKAGKCSLAGIYQLGQKDIKQLAELIKPSGFYQQKAERIFSLAKFILKNYKGVERLQKQDLIDLRQNLMALKGLGPETADAILLYALEKPVFVIDEYTKRLVKKRKLTEQSSYESLQQLFQENLPKDYALYQDFHALIIIEEKSPPGQGLLLKT